MLKLILWGIVIAAIVVVVGGTSLLVAEVMGIYHIIVK